jgi:hypothetical protein
MPSFGGKVKLSVPCHRFAACKRFRHLPWKSHVVGKIDLAISHPYLLPSLIEVSHIAGCGAPLVMMGETKSGAQRVRSYGLGALGLQGPGSTPTLLLLLILVNIIYILMHSDDWRSLCGAGSITLHCRYLQVNSFNTGLWFFFTVSFFEEYRKHDYKTFRAICHNIWYDFVWSHGYGQKSVLCMCLTLWLCSFLHLTDGRSDIDGENFEQDTRNRIQLKYQDLKEFCKILLLTKYETLAY